MEELSLAGEVLLLAIDPREGGLITKPRPLRRAVAVAQAVEAGRGRPRRFGGRSALRAARAELQNKGLLDRGELRLANPKDARERYARLMAAVHANEFADDRQKQLFALAAGAGALAPRMSGEERRIARRRLASMRPPALGRSGRHVPNPVAMAAGMAPMEVIFAAMASGIDSNSGGLEAGATDSGGGGGGFDASDGGGGGFGGGDGGGGGN